MPLFFVLSGYLASRRNREDIPSFFKKLMISRIVPFLFFNLLILPFYFIDAAFTNSHADVPQLLSRSLYLLAGRPAFNFITWFLICLASVEVIHYLVFPLVRNDKRKMILAIILCYLAGWYAASPGNILNTLLFKDYWYVREAVLACSFYLFGSMLPAMPMLRDTLPAKSAFPMGILSTGLLVVAFNLNEGPFRICPVVAVAFAGYGNILLFPLTAIAGTVSIAIVSRWLGTIGIFQYLGRNTLVLMGLNGILAQFPNVVFLTRFQGFLSGSPLTTVFLCFVLTVLSIILCIPCVYLLNRYLPRAVGSPRPRPRTF